MPETEAAPGPPLGSGRGPQRLGINLVSLIAALREQGWLPISPNPPKDADPTPSSG